MNFSRSGETSRFWEDSLLPSRRILARDPVSGTKAASFLSLWSRSGYVESSLDGMPVVSLYSDVMHFRRWEGMASWSLLWRRTIRSHVFVARGLLSRMFGWITTWRGREARMTLVLDDCLSCWMKDSVSVDFASSRRWSVAIGMMELEFWNCGMKGKMNEGINEGIRCF